QAAARQPDGDHAILARSDSAPAWGAAIVAGIGEDPGIGMIAKNKPLLFRGGVFQPYFFAGGATVIFTSSPDWPGKLVNIASISFGTITVILSSSDRAFALPSNTC